MAHFLKLLVQFICFFEGNEVFVDSFIDCLLLVEQFQYTFLDKPAKEQIIDQISYFRVQLRFRHCDYGMI